MNLGERKPRVWSRIRHTNKNNYVTIIHDKKQTLINKHKPLAIVAGFLALAGLSGLTAFAVTMIQDALSSDGVNYQRIADPNTMEDYLNDSVLGIQDNSRNAGRIWTDKTVFAKGYQFTDTTKDYKGNDPNLRFSEDGTLSLDAQDDGSTSSVKTNTDFLQVYSALGSSQVVDQYNAQPLDVVLLLDVSTSMTRLNGSNMNTNDSLHKVLDQANKLINQLMGNDPAHPVASDNRIGVVVYGGGSQEVLPLGHYTSATNDGTYVKITDKTNKSSGSGYFPIISSNVVSKSTSTKVMLADATYLQGALYKGLKMLADEPNTTYKNPYTNDVEARTPILISLTDGATNTISTTYSSGGSGSYEWWAPFDGIIPTYSSSSQYAGNATNPYYADCNDNTGYGTDNSGRNSADNRLKETEAISARNVSNLLLAGYYKKKIQANYETDMKGFSINFNTNGLGEYPTEQLLGTLDPKTYFQEGREIDFSYLNSTKKIPDSQKAAKKAEIEQNAKKQVDKTKELLTSYINHQPTTYRFPESGNHIFLSSGHAEFTWNHPADTANDVTSLEDVYYIDQSYNANDSDIESVFDDIFEKISTVRFNPIEGDNDAGVANSLFYMDPIGEYMEIKDDGVTFDGKTHDMAILLFEKMYGIDKTGIYDYRFASTHRGPDHNSSTEGTFQEGWYNSDGELIGWYDKDEDGNNTGNIHGVAGSFENGDTYYFTINTIRKYVSTLAEDESALSNQEKNTIYTAYRFSDDNDVSAYDQQDNPCFEKRAGVQFALNDFRIWTEETGDFTDEQGGAAIDLGYKQAIYVNVPNNALPLITANISIDTGGDVNYQYDLDYLENMEHHNSNHVTPFRLFYGVGLENDILTNDGHDIDIAKLEVEYLEHHKHKDTGDLYFLSNYFSDTKYDDYVSDDSNSRRRGDANSTFSPADINRYYIFQKPLTLYKINASDEMNQDDQGQPIYTEKTLSTSEYEEFVKNHENDTIKDGDIDSNAWYWIVGDYYSSEGLVHLAVTRMGSEFGSAIGSDGGEISYGEYLIWYNPSGEGLLKDNIRDFNKDLDTPPDDSGNWVIATKPGGLRVGDLSQVLIGKEKNVTNTADTVLVPTVSSNTTRDDVIIDNYLGNNGKIILPNKLLQVTKEVETDSMENFEPDREFNFEVKVIGYTGEHQAIVLIKNPYSHEWQLRMNTIDIVTSNKGLLQKNGHGATEPAVITRDGQKYYVYVGAAADDMTSGNTFPLFDVDHTNDIQNAGRTVYVNPEDYETLQHNSKYNMRYAPVDRDNTVGSVDYWLDKVYLIPANTDLETWTFDQATADSLYRTESQFVISHLDSHLNGIDQLSSDYMTQSTYLTRTVYFGYDDATKPDAKPEDFTGTDEDWAWITDTSHANQTKFILKDGEGLEFVGLTHGNDYDVSVVEVVDDYEVEEGYTFERVEDNESGLQEHETIDNREQGETRYKVSGYITDRVEEHYINKYRPNYDLTLDNTVMGTHGDKGKDWTFRVKLTPTEFEKFKTAYFYQKCTPKENPIENEDPLDCRDVDGEKLKFTPSEDGQFYEATLTLKHGDIYRIKNIDNNTKYSVTEDEANTEDYDTVYRVKGYDKGDDVITQDRKVGIINAKFATTDLDISKTVKGSLGDQSQAWNFKLTLLPEEGYVLNDTYPASGDLADSELKFTKQDDGTYTANFSLAHGQHINLTNLPENLHYNLEEDGANDNGYITTVEEDNADGNLASEGETTDIDFVNAKYDSRNLSIAKLVEGSRADTNEEFTFNITLIPDTDITLAEKYPYVGSHIVPGASTPQDGELVLTRHDDAGVYYTGQVSLKHGQKINIENIPEGTQYKVEEEDVSDEGYTTEVPTNNSGMLITQGENVTFVNVKASNIDLNIEKQVVNGNPTDENQTWPFEIYLTPPVGITLESQYSYTSSDGTDGGTITLADQDDGSFRGEFTLKHGQKISLHGLPEGTRYEIHETNANTNGFINMITDNTTGVLTYDAAPTVRFTNTKLDPNTLTVGKTVLGEAGSATKSWTFEITLQNTGQTNNEIYYHYTGGTTVEGLAKPDDGQIAFRRYADGNTYVGQITLRHGQYVTLEGLATGATYSIAEAEANTENYATFTANDSDNGAISDALGSLVIYNNLLPGEKDLTLAKIVHGVSGLADVENGKTFDYQLVLTPIDHVTLKEAYHYDGTKSGDLTLTDNHDGSYAATLSGLTHSDSITIHGLPERTKYAITETGADEYAKRIEGSAGDDLTARAIGRLWDANTTVTYHNTKLSDLGLSIKKTVGGNLGDTAHAWTFKVTLTAAPGTVLNHEYPFEKNTGERGTLQLRENVLGNLEGEIAVRDGETATIEQLPEGTKYIVEEVDPAAADYTVSSSNNTKGIVNQGDLLVEFHNWKSSRSQLTVEKQLTGNDTEPDRDWNFEVLFTPNPDEPDWSSSYNFVKSTGEPGTLDLVRNVDGTWKGTFTLKGNQSIDIKDIPYGTSYFVRELGANEDRYESTFENNSGVLTDDIHTATFENHRDILVTYHGLSIKKSVAGDLGDTERGWKFTISLTPGEKITLDDSYEFTKDTGETGTLTLKDNGDGGKTGTLELKDGETLTIEQLPERTTYKFEEEDLAAEGYRVFSDNTEGVVGENNPVAEFKNWKSSRHDLTFVKVLTGTDTEPDRDWNFEAVFTPDPNEPDWPATLAFVKSTGEADELALEDNGDGTWKAKFTLKGGQSLTLKNIPYGTYYTFRELEADADRYKTAAENRVGSLTAMTTVVFMNHRDALPVEEPEQPDEPLSVPSTGTSSNGDFGSGSASSDELLNVPNTADPILKYVAIFVASLAGLGGVAWRLRRRR